MRRLSCLILALSAILLVAADTPKQPPADLALLAGTWTVQSAEREGKPDKGPLGDTVTFSDDSMKVVEKRNGQTHELKIKLDGSQQPKQIDLIHKAGERAETVQGIYKIEKDVLRICASQPDKPRPSDFSTKANDGRAVVVLKRAQKE